jgi:medium-chain acyl-CoA synthetase
VAESAVVSSPDSTRGEVVKAFVVLTPEYESADHILLRKELQEFCKANSAPYKYPRKIQFVHGAFLPKTTSGKIQRSELKKWEWQNKVKAKL